MKNSFAECADETDGGADRHFSVMPDLIRHPASPRLRAERTLLKRVFCAMDIARWIPDQVRDDGEEMVGVRVNHRRGNCAARAVVLDNGAPVGDKK